SSSHSSSALAPPCIPSSSPVLAARSRSGMPSKEIKCPVQSCTITASQESAICSHLRLVHAGVFLDSVVENTLDIRRCPICTKYFHRRGFEKHSGSCVHKHPSAPSPLS